MVKIIATEEQIQQLMASDDSLNSSMRPTIDSAYSPETWT